MKTPMKPASVFLFVLILSILIKLCVLDIMRVSGPSMLPTLTEGTIVCEYKLAWGIPVPFRNSYFLRWGEPKVGDLIIYPWLGRYVIKRCLATGGTKLVFSHDSGYSVQMGEVMLPLTREHYEKMRHITEVPVGTVFAAGDNPAESRDSREYGCISLDSIRGKVIFP
ncbi:MAG: signal peptidase I [Spirochaetales bacterium]|nr:signal peptidase I [Spirochaetales bacterium]